MELVPTAACWVEITAATGHGPVLFAGTLRPGTRQPVPAGVGGVRVQLGNPGAMSLVVDGAPMAVPRPVAGGPFTLVFQPPAKSRRTGEVTGLLRPRGGADSGNRMPPHVSRLRLAPPAHR